MAERRMFSKEITNSSDFLMMSQSAQNLYFHAGMNSDDDGFFEVFTIMRMTESKPDDLNALHSRGFIYVVDGKVAIVKDWHKNNQVRADRYKQSKYLKDENYREIYLTIMGDKLQELSVYTKLATNSIPLVAKRLPQDSIGKVSIVEDSIDNNISIDKSIEPKKKRKKSKKPPEVTEIYNYYREIYGFTKTNPPLPMENLGASEWLFKNKGIDAAKQAILAAKASLEAHINGDQYAPAIYNLVDLRDHYDKLRAYYGRKRRELNNAKNSSPIG